MTNRIHVVIAVLVLCLIPTSIAAQPAGSRTDVGAAPGADYLPIDPVPAPIRQTTGQPAQLWADLSTKDVFNALSVSDSYTSVYKLDQSGNLTYLSAGATASKGVYRVVIDYLKWVPQTVMFGGNAVNARVGVGLRLDAEILATAANVDLGSILKIGAAVANQQARGTMTVTAIGVNSSDIINLFPTPAKIDDTAIQKALEALAAIQIKMSDDGTILTPHVTAVQKSGGERVASTF